MKNLTEEGERFQSFVSRIRKAETNEDVERILNDMRPKHIKERLTKLSKKHGTKVGNRFVYQYSSYTTSYNNFNGVVELHREGFGCIFKMGGDAVLEFNPIPTWKSMNLIEELIETNEITL